MGLAEDEQRRGEATTSACGSDEASGARPLHTLGRQEPSGQRNGDNALLLPSNSHQQQPDLPPRHSLFPSHHLPSHHLPFRHLPSHHQQLPLLGPRPCHQAPASSTHDVAFDLDLDFGNGSGSRGASSRLQLTDYNLSSPTILDDEAQRAALGLCSSSDEPTLAFAVVQQPQTDLLSAALPASFSLPGRQFDDIDDTGSASQLSLATSSCHSRPDPFSSAQGLTRMALAADSVAPQSVSFDSYYPHHVSDHLSATHTNTDLPILNAQQYDLMGSHGTSKANVMRKTPRTTNSTPATGKPATGKRSRPTSHAEGVGEDGGDLEEDEGRRKRSRGRPRLDTKDENAADRRRTQIRLAQRAYRHRKDTAITTLEQRVKDLEKANESMSKEFSDFYETLMAERMLDSAPHAAHRLRSIADKFLASASVPKEGTIGSSESQASDADDQPLFGHPLRRNTAGSSNSSGEKQMRPVLAHPRQHFRLGGGSPSTPNIHMPSSLSYEVVTQPTPDNASFPFYASMEQGSQNYMGQLSQPTPYSTVPAPASYAAHEVTFGRRFQRANLEAGLRLISMPNPPPDRYAAVFGFCLFFESREAIIRRLSSTLSGTQQETLNYWKAPFTNLGGAGTFFMGGESGANLSRDSSENGSLPIGNQGTREYGKPEETTGFSMGPFSAEVEATRDDRLDHRMRMLFTGFEGDFFDTDEVETYLRRLGITIPQSADFVEAEINIADLEDETTPVHMGSNVVGAGEQGTYTAAGLISPDSGYGSISGPVAGGMWPTGSPESGRREPRPAPADMAMASQPMASVLSSGVTSGASDMNSGLVAFMYPPGLDGMWTTASNWQRSKVSINVNMLVNEMVNKSLCLGRSPGIRRKDVNRAVKVAAGLI
ncbi:hypothetical protein TOPH_06741 [Tolypocladium ophioglossoides CBS 100239]|uniref:BZIP domain-containing protein n=1 Tax=Tolypocladium ophioglossoides (strain CBS 100239) TaxID=1163406 RepID=A0A0L0N463_TOLOC|nr:hypothetical protein TOPH_06741 [Tolypocladium ophioglossoides CBS 100239]